MLVDVERIFFCISERFFISNKKRLHVLIFSLLKKENDPSIERNANFLTIIVRFTFDENKLYDQTIQYHIIDKF